MRKASAEYIKLMEYVKSQPDGTSLDYDKVQKDTGISMLESRNRNFLSRAINKSGRRALVFPGLGYQLDDPKNTMQIIDKAGVKVFRQIKRSSTTTRIVTLKHGDKLEPDEQGRLKAIGGLYNILERRSGKFEEITIKTYNEIIPPTIEGRK